MNTETTEREAVGQPELCSSCHGDLCLHCTGCPSHGCGSCECRHQDPAEVAAAEPTRLCRDCQEPLADWEVGQHADCVEMHGEQPEEVPGPDDQESDYPANDEPSQTEIDRAIQLHMRWLEEVG